MFNHHNDKQYRIYKTKFKFKNPVMKVFYPEKQDKDLVNEEENKRVIMNSEDEEVEQEFSDIYYDLYDIFNGLRKNSKRRLEILIRKYKNNINELDKEEKDELLEFISQKFYNTSLCEGDMTLKKPEEEPANDEPC